MPGVIPKARVFTSGTRDLPSELPPGSNGIWVKRKPRQTGPRYRRFSLLLEELSLLELVFFESSFDPPLSLDEPSFAELSFEPSLELSFEESSDLDLLPSSFFESDPPPSDDGV
jgi:hypothetical protein